MCLKIFVVLLLWIANPNDFSTFPRFLNLFLLITHNSSLFHLLKIYSHLLFYVYSFYFFTFRTSTLSLYFMDSNFYISKMFCQHHYIKIFTCVCFYSFCSFICTKINLLHLWSWFSSEKWGWESDLLSPDHKLFAPLSFTEYFPYWLKILLLLYITVKYEYIRRSGQYFLLYVAFLLCWVLILWNAVAL